MYDFSKPPCIYWDITTKINYLQRRIIVYSIMYYELNESCISDKEYDNISHMLVKLQAEATETELKESKYYYAMYDFDGSTGFDIPDRLNNADKEYLENIAMHVYNRWKGSTKK